MLNKDSAAYAGIFYNNKKFPFIEVDNIDAIATALNGLGVVMPRHKTFYVSTELGYREPRGHCVSFAQFKR